MFKTKGFNEGDSLQTANAIEQATQSVIMQQAMNDIQKEKKSKNRSLSSSNNDGQGIQSAHSSISSAKNDHYDDRDNNDDDGDDDKLFNEEDDDEFEFRRLREQRIEALKNQRKEMQDNIIKGHGKYEEVFEEDFLKAVTGSKYCVCAFYHRDFERCKIVDKHMALLAPKHLPTRFIKIDAEKTKFFVAKLAIRMLPTIVCFVDGVAVDRIVGFSELGGVDDFKTVVLEARLEQAGVVARAETVKQFKKEQQQKKKLTTSIQRRGMGWD